MRLLFTRHLKLRHLAISIALIATAAAIASTTGVLASAGIPLGISTACGCEGLLDEEVLEEREGREVRVDVFGTGRCTGNIKREDTSTVAHNPIRVIMEKGKECTLRREGCRGFEFRRTRDFCETALESPGPMRSPEYEWEDEYEGVREGPFKIRLTP